MTEPTVTRVPIPPGATELVITTHSGWGCGGSVTGSLTIEGTVGNVLSGSFGAEPEPGNIIGVLARRLKKEDR